MRLILHTAAYWLMLTVRGAIPRTHALATAEFNTIRLRLLKVGARVVEMTSRVRLAFAAACPDATLIRHIAAALMPTGRKQRGSDRPGNPSRKPSTLTQRSTSRRNRRSGRR